MLTYPPLFGVNGLYNQPTIKSFDDLAKKPPRETKKRKKKRKERKEKTKGNHKKTK